MTVAMFSAARQFMLLCLIVTGLGACTTIRLASDYDEVSDRELTALYSETSSFVDRMVALRATPEGQYSANQNFYSNAIGRVDALIARAQGNQVLNDCPSTAVMSRILSTANLPEAVRTQVGTIPEGACPVVLLQFLKQNYQSMRTVHQNEGVLSEFLSRQFMEGGVGALLRAAIMVEVAKRQS